jgi:glycosyltransferase involved in cell wall biosynthesis
VKVCMISGPARSAGGLEHVVNEISSHLVSRDVQFTVFTSSNRDFVTEKQPGYRTVEVRPYDFLPHNLRKAYYDKVVYSLKVWRKMRVHGPFDIVHGHGDNCLFPSFSRNETPFIMTFHGTRAKSQKRFDPQVLPVLYAEKIAASKCDVAVACSNAVKEELTSFYGVEPRKVSVIHNGVDVDKFYPQDKLEARKKLNLPLNRTYGIWVGMNPELKRLSTARQALAGLENVCLLVVGVSGVSDGKTLFWGRVESRELMRMLYNAADFLVFPSRYEGFPVTPLEALACGLPVIVSKESNSGEIVEDGVHGFVVGGGNPQRYREKAQFLLDNPALLKRMSSDCRQLALKYSWQNQAGKYWKLYQRLLKQ